MRERGSIHNRKDPRAGILHRPGAVKSSCLPGYFIDLPQQDFRGTLPLNIGGSVPQCIEKSGGNVHTKTLPFRNLQTSAALAACAGTKLHVKNLFFTLETCFFEKIN